MDNVCNVNTKNVLITKKLRINKKKNVSFRLWISLELHLPFWNIILLLIVTSLQLAFLIFVNFLHFLHFKI